MLISRQRQALSLTRAVGVLVVVLLLRANSSICPLSLAIRVADLPNLPWNE